MSVTSTSTRGSMPSRSESTNSARSTSSKASSVAGPGSTPSAAIKRQAEAVRGPWADHPFHLIKEPSIAHDTRHPAVFVANDMAHQHNAALRGLNAIYIQAPHIQYVQDITDFLFLVQCWGLWIQYYDNLRRNSIFPKFEEALQKPGFLLMQIREETNFAPSLDRLLEYVQETHAEVETYDAEIFQSLVHELGVLFRAHLADTISMLLEIPWLCSQMDSPAAKFKAGRISQIYRKIDKDASGAMDLHIVPPMLMRMRDTTSAGGNSWPGVPLIALDTIDRTLSKTHAGAWRFLPCNVWGKPRELAFLGQQDTTGGGGGSREGIIKIARVVSKVPPRSPRREHEQVQTIIEGGEF
ncbi:hypothetical protein E8E14_011901 [Neopestalotiopsis sp. 37M]|nr:hypothetical protein E8E14_011901 [Neopestalotiopsis sp. 37M]